MRRAAGEADALDAAAATQTMFSCAAIHAELVLKASLQSGTADVVLDGGAALVDGPVQHNGYGLSQCRPARRQLVAKVSRVQSGFEQSFIRIDVAHARQHALIEQHRFQASPRVRQPRAPVFRIDVRTAPALIAIPRKTPPVRCGRQIASCCRSGGCRESAIAGSGRPGRRRNGCAARGLSGDTAVS